MKTSRHKCAFHLAAYISRWREKSYYATGAKSRFELLTRLVENRGFLLRPCTGVGYINRERSVFDQCVGDRRYAIGA
jgi:hypothetical protein